MPYRRRSLRRTQKQSSNLFRKNLTEGIDKMMSTTQTDTLAPIEIREVVLEDTPVIRFIRFHEPLKLKPEWLPDSDSYAEIVYPELNIDVYGDSHDALVRAVHSDIRFEWRRLVQKRDDELTPQALRVKQNYLEKAKLSSLAPFRMFR
jgi:hypothetical protein